MIKPNPTVAAMAPYALPDLSVPDGLEAIGLVAKTRAFQNFDLELSCDGEVFAGSGPG